MAVLASPGVDAVTVDIARIALDVAALLAVLAA